MTKIECILSNFRPNSTEKALKINLVNWIWDVGVPVLRNSCVGSSNLYFVSWSRASSTLTFLYGVYLFISVKHNINTTTVILSKRCSDCVKIVASHFSKRACSSRLNHLHSSHSINYVGCQWLIIVTWQSRQDLNAVFKHSEQYTFVTLS